ncbi:hypothetical protein GASC598I20_006710 [Gilliamella apicola SCGC AB-598-I20]|nr:hypothetical protein GASC598I20_006710 [Gilliamella apicola SCGC AB-598-I20]
MSKFVCRCGHIMDLSNEDNDYEYSFVEEKKINEIIWILEKTITLSNRTILYQKLIISGLEF